MTDNLHTTDSLAARISAGDEKAFEQFHDEYYVTFLAYTNRLINDRQESENIVSETFEKLWTRKRNFHGKDLSNIRAFMYVACRNSAYNFLKYAGGKARKNEILASDVHAIITHTPVVTDIESEIIKQELFKEMYEAISRLPRRQAELMVLILNRKTYKEISRILNLKETAIRTLRWKAILNLRKLLLQQKLFTAVVFTLLHINALSWLLSFICLIFT